ncbi:monovalent cation/H(+) antiporter subunit G [Haliangium sp.]|uniref:monovalent cation/H(+) antiporter subunit G n=1 Tax=Haliangium sp. TaxID=2663208 RepID=UPI003D1253DB
MTALPLILACAGVAFVFLAALGVVRMPDLYARMQAASKAATLGVALVAVAAAVHFGDGGVTWRVVLAVLLLFVTAPVAAHAIARAAYRSGVPLAGEAVIDELGASEGRPRPARPDTSATETEPASAEPPPAEP